MLMHFLRLIFRSSYMIRSMVIRDIRRRYVGSLLGIFWSVIQPLTQLLIYYFIFSVVFKMRLGPEYGETHYAVWLISGLLPWLLFADVLNRSPNSVLEQSSLIKKMVFPSEILPIVTLSSAIISHLIGMAILIGLLVALGGAITIKIILIIPYLFALGLFSLGISWILSSLNVYLRDIGQVISVFVTIWFYLTPVVYSRQFVPLRLQKIYALNPMLHIIEGYRMALLGKTDMDIGGFGYALAAGVILLVIGAFTFRRLKPAFADVL
ncbi:MAG: ABC transporter permease [Nitrospirae bacterium]|nr:ABC transporter permease [Nitrospirota bacterium]